MKCSACNQTIPDDSLFCPFCGNKKALEPLNKQSVILDAQKDINNEEAHVNTRSDTSKSIQPEDSAFTSDITDKETANNTPKKQKKDSFSRFIILFMIISTVLGLGVFLYRNLETSSMLKDHLPVLDSSTRESANKYEAIISSLTKHTDSKFCASEYVFVLAPKKTVTFTLTTINETAENQNVFYELNGKSAKIEFTEDEWLDSTELKITALSTGITTARFRNSSNSKSFDIIIYVVK